MQGGGRGYYIKEFIGFIRPKISLFITGIGISGYLLFNSVSEKLIFVALSSFFAAVMAYTYNRLTDKNEDLINHKNLNLFVRERYGYLFVPFFFLLGFIFSLFLSRTSVIFFLIWTIAGIIYSALRIKEIFLLKNIYTAFIMPLSFFVGAFANSQITFIMVEYYMLVALLVLVISLLGDLRDYEGDKASGINTIAVVLSYTKVRKLALSTLGLFSFLVLLLSSKAFYFLMPFILMAAIFLVKNNLKNTRICILSSFAFLPFILAIMKSVGGI